MHLLMFPGADLVNHSNPWESPTNRIKRPSTYENISVFISLPEIETCKDKVSAKKGLLFQHNLKTIESQVIPVDPQICVPQDPHKQIQKTTPLTPATNSIKQRKDPLQVCKPESTQWLLYPNYPYVPSHVSPHKRPTTHKHREISGNPIVTNIKAPTTIKHLRLLLQKPNKPPKSLCTAKPLRALLKLQALCRFSKQGRSAPIAQQVPCALK